MQRWDVGKARVDRQGGRVGQPQVAAAAGGQPGKALGPRDASQPGQRAAHECQSSQRLENVGCIRWAAVVWHASCAQPPLEAIAGKQEHQPGCQAQQRARLIITAAAGSCVHCRCCRRLAAGRCGRRIRADRHLNAPLSRYSASILRWQALHSAKNAQVTGGVRVNLGPTVDARKRLLCLASLSKAHLVRYALPEGAQLALQTELHLGHP